MIRFKSYVLPFAIVMGFFLHDFCVKACFISPYLIFTILLLNYASVDTKSIRFSPLDFWIITFQITVSLGSYFVLKFLGASEIVAQGVLGGILCPVAAASVVISCMLGAKREIVTAYTIFGNIMVVIVAPIYFSFIGIHQDMPFLDSFLLIIRRIFPIIGLPLFIVWILQKVAPAANDFLQSHKEASFYLWATALTLVIGQTMDFLIKHGKENLSSIILLGILSIFFCVVQFAFGKWLGSKYGDRIAGGQLMGQKNSAFGVWMANTYLVPLASVYPALYSIWQNLFNSWQLWRHNRR